MGIAGVLIPQPRKIAVRMIRTIDEIRKRLRGQTPLPKKQELPKTKFRNIKKGERAY